ncbi:MULTISPECIES: thiazole tautomerase TenI [Paenibacillus]|uniref:Thiamine phosphate synthase n=1 Tax=Paenibacillus albilobatus TaxID=2716884 RepID=A0A920CC00_9BACL|nr:MULTISPECIES: thiazole tautomerase TenI [Paenibacillus]GIO34015.1 thiamine phosphate synthase [Paenibacillus albilobatus]
MAGRELHVVSTGRQPLDELARIAGLIHPYVDAIHLREHAKTARELLNGIGMLLAAGVPADRIVVNDRADVAAAAGVQGVQLAYHSLDVTDVKEWFPQLRIGRSVHSLKEAVEAEKKGADYVFFGHVYPTASKPDSPARGLRELKLLASRTRIPVIAIGGVKPANVAETLKAGASGVAVMSGILEAADPIREAAAYHQCLHRGRENNHGPSS